MFLSHWLARHTANPARRRPSAVRRNLDRCEDRITPASLFHGGEGSSWDTTTTGAVGLVEARIGGQTDAFDGVGRIEIDGTQLDSKVTRNGNSAAYSPVALSGLNAANTYFFAPSSSVARQLLSLSNPTAADKTVSVVLTGNLGSDGGTQVITTASGNTTVETADRWIVTDDADKTAGDPAVTTVFFGPGTPAVTPSAVTLTGDNYSATYSVTVPAGQTKSLMFFHQVSPTAADATFDATNSKGAYWGVTNAVTGNDFLSGLTNAELANVVNWAFGSGAGVAPLSFSGGEGSSWFVSNTGSTSLREASIGNQTDALDTDNWNVSVGGTLLTGVPSLTDNSAVYPPVSLSGLDVSTTFFFAPSSSVARQFLSLANPGTTDKTVTISLLGNLGSDGGTQVIASGNGNATVEAADRWIVTDDADKTAGDPAVTTVFFGPGTPAVTPSAVTLAGDAYSATYSVTVPAGQTKALMFFHQVSPTADDATADANGVTPIWSSNSNPITGNDVLSGLTDAQLATVANWAFGAPPNTAVFHAGEGAGWRVSATGNTSLEEGSIGSQSDAFDGGNWNVSVDAKALTGVPTLSGNSAVYPAVALSGLNVDTAYFFAPSSSVARQLLSLSNPTAADKTVSVVLTGNLGSDGGTQVITTASGNTTVETADRWIVTDDADKTAGDPAVTTVFFGPGTPAVTPSAVTLTGDNYSATYSVTVPAGQTKSLMFFHQLNRTAAEAGTDAVNYFSNDGVVENDLFSGLSQAQRGQIVNYILNTPPVAADDTATVAEDGTVTIAVLANDSDADADTLTVSAVSAAGKGAVAIVGGSVKYTPNPDFNGADTFTYTASDAAGGTVTGKVAVTVTPVNDNPTITDIPDQSTLLGTAVGPVAFTIGDVETAVGTLTLTAASSNAAVVPVANVTFGGAGANRTVTVTPAAGQAGSSTITVTVADADGGTATDTFVVTANTPPVAVADSAGTAFQTPVTVAVLTNDTDADGDALSVTAATNGTNGTVAVNAGLTVTYTPNVGFTGTDTFTYTVSDGKGGTATAGVTVTVAPANKLPVAVADVATAVAGSAKTIAVLTNDTDADGDALSVTAATNGTNGTVAVNAGLTVTYTPNVGFTGTDTFTYTVSDGKGGTATAGVTVTVLSAVGLVGFKEFAAGTDIGTSGRATLFNPDGSARYTVTAFDASFTGGVRTAAADFNGDGVADTVVGTGPGRATRVRILSGTNQAELFGVDPFEATFTGGVYVTAGDLNGDGTPDLIITPDEGGGPRVDVYSGKGFGKFASFFGIDDTGFRGGARASTGDMNADGRADLIVVAGFGGGPRVAGFDGKSVGGTPSRIFGDFFAFEQTLRNGIFVTVGDLNGDGNADLICGGGPGGGPRVLAFGGKELITNTQNVLANFFGGNPDSRGGIRMGVKNLDGDNRADLVVGAGAGAGSRVTAYLGKNIGTAGTPPSTLDFDAFTGFAGGVFVG